MSTTLQEDTLTPQQYANLKTDSIADENPMLTQQQYDRLKADIQTNKQQYPIIVFENSIIDGRNRFKAIRELGMDLRVVKVTSSKEDAVKLASSFNDKRRHISKAQYAMMAAYKIRDANTKPDGTKKPKPECMKYEDVEEVQSGKVSLRMVTSALTLFNRDEAAAKEVFEGTKELHEALENPNNTHKVDEANYEETLRTTYSDEAVTSYKGYIAKGKYTKKALAKELVEAKIIIQTLQASQNS